MGHIIRLIDFSFPLIICNRTQRFFADDAEHYDTIYAYATPVGTGLVV